MGPANSPVVCRPLVGRLRPGGEGSIAGAAAGPLAEVFVMTMPTAAGLPEKVDQRRYRSVTAAAVVVGRPSRARSPVPGSRASLKSNSLPRDQMARRYVVRVTLPPYPTPMSSGSRSVAANSTMSRRTNNHTRSASGLYSRSVATLSVSSRVPYRRNGNFGLAGTLRRGCRHVIRKNRRELSIDSGSPAHTVKLT